VTLSSRNKTYSYTSRFTTGNPRCGSEPDGTNMLLVSSLFKRTSKRSMNYPGCCLGTYMFAPCVALKQCPNHTLHQGVMLSTSKQEFLLPRLRHRNSLTVIEASFGFPCCLHRPRSANRSHLPQLSCQSGKPIWLPTDANVEDCAGNLPTISDDSILLIRLPNKIYSVALVMSNPRIPRHKLGIRAYEVNPFSS